MKSRLLAIIVVLGAFVGGYATGGTALRAQVASTMSLAFAVGDTVQLRLVGRPLEEQCVVEGFATGFVNCKGEEAIAYNLAQVVSARVTARAQR